MFNYFILQPNAPFLTSFEEPNFASDSSNEAKVSQAEYLTLREKYDQLKDKYQSLKKENSQLLDQINQIEDSFEPEKVRRRKFKRRTQAQLSKEYACPYPNCKKEYASPLALNFHIRSKHGGGTKKERMAYIKLLIEAQQKGEERPQTKLKLCNDLLNSEIKSYRQKLQQDATDSIQKNSKGDSSAEIQGSNLNVQQMNDHIFNDY